MAKKLLLVDDEQVFLEGLQEGLSKHAGIFQTDIAYSVDEAIRKCKKTRYNLVVSDIRMPGKSGLDLFVYLRKKRFKGGFIAMTAFGTEEVLKRIRQLGGLDVIMKPFNLEWVTQKILDFFVEKEGISGNIDSIDITSLLQMINLERKTLTVKIDLNGLSGYLHFQTGEIVHAEFEDLRGLEAAQSLLNLNRGHFSLQEPVSGIEHSIDMPFMVLLMNAMKEIDEEAIQLSPEDILSGEKEKPMNVKQMEKAVEVLKDDLGDGMLATDIIDANDGQSLAGWNTQAKASALFAELTSLMDKTLKGAGFPALGRYYIIDLVDDKMVVLITMGSFLWGMLLDSKKAKLGLLLNIAIPKAIDAFEEAIAG
ncbi:MAG: response regulator [Acidobacteriota bacterium]|nr:response regulator [Acidobacteriota bacterium]